MECLKDNDGVWVYDQCTLKELVVNFYNSLFCAKDEFRVCIRANKLKNKCICVCGLFSGMMKKFSETEWFLYVCV